MTRTKDGWLMVAAAWVMTVVAAVAGEKRVKPVQLRGRVAERLAKKYGVEVTVEYLLRASR